MTRPRAFMSAGAFFRTSLTASGDWGETVWAGIVWQIAEVGSSAWASGDFGGRVRAWQRYNGMWVACLLISLVP